MSQKLPPTQFIEEYVLYDAIVSSYYEDARTIAMNVELIAEIQPKLPRSDVGEEFIAAQIIIEHRGVLYRNRNFFIIDPYQSGRIDVFESQKETIPTVPTFDTATAFNFFIDVKDYKSHTSTYITMVVDIIAVECRLGESRIKNS